MKWFLYPLVASVMATFPDKSVWKDQDAFVHWIDHLAVALLASGATSFMLWLQG